MAANLAGLAFIPYYKHLMDILDTNAELKKTSKGIFKQMAWAAGGTAVGGCVGGPPGALIGGIVGIFKQMAWAAGGTAVGGCVGGPPGALIGGIVGSAYGYFKSDDYNSMVTVLQNLTDAEKQNLVNKVQELVGSSTLEALTAFITSQVQRELLINCLRQFINNKGGG